MREAAVPDPAVPTNALAALWQPAQGTLAPSLMKTEQSNSSVLYGDRLVLTHYCTASNQPHMQAAAYDPVSNRIQFDFAGGGSLANANAGHMHNALFTFNGPDTFTANWTFQENGKPKFVEKIEYHRVK